LAIFRIRATFASFTIAFLLGSASTTVHLSSDRDLDLDTGFDVDDDLLDDLGRGVEAAGYY
jgi:hypothetical protein